MYCGSLSNWREIRRLVCDTVMVGKMENFTTEIDILFCHVIVLAL